MNSENHNIKSDNELIALYKENRQKLLVGELYKRYTQFVFLISMKYLKNDDLSKDATLEIFEKLFDDLLRHEIENFKSWLHVVTKNYCLQKLRKEKILLKNQNEFEKNSSGFMENATEFYPIDKNEKEEKLNQLENAIEKLKDTQKVCIKLFYLEEKSYTEIVEITGFPLKKVKSYIQNGKRNIKIHIESSGIGIFFILLF